MRENHPLWCQAHEPLRCGSDRTATETQQKTKVERRLAVRPGDAEQVRCGLVRRAEMIEIKVLHEIRQDQRSAALVEQLDLAEHRGIHRYRLQVGGPFLRRNACQFAVDADARRAHLPAGRKAAGGECLCVRQFPLPLGQEHPMRDVRRQQISYRAQSLQMVTEVGGISHRRMQHEITVGQPDDDHADGQLLTGGTDWLVIYNPDLVCDAS